MIVMETTSVPGPAAPTPALPAARRQPRKLPVLYRAILDRVAALEGLGERREAARIRHLATGTYSGAWDAAGRRSLVALLARADRAIAGELPIRTWVPRRRSAPARSGFGRAV